MYISREEEAIDEAALYLRKKLNKVYLPSDRTLLCNGAMMADMHLLLWTSS